MDKGDTTDKSYDKTHLLNQLKIDKSAAAPPGLSMGHLAIASLISAVVGGVLVFLFSPSSEPPPEPAKKAIAANSTKTNSAANDAASTPTEITPIPASSRILNASGYIAARRVATVSAEVMGLITAVEVEEGMKVDRGQVLATLDDSVAQVNLRLARAQVEAQKAQIESIQIDLREAERVLKRVSRLGTDSYSSEAQLTRAQTDADKFRSALASAKANLRVAELNVAHQQELVNDHIIRAPFAGVVTVKNAQTGEIVAPAAAGGGFTRTGICTIVDMDSLEIEVDVNEAFIGRVFENQRVIANLDAYPDWNIPASVIAIIPTADRAKATVQVRIKIEEKDARILPDMGVKVAFLKGKE